MWASNHYSFIKSKGLDEIGTCVNLEAVPEQGVVCDLGHWPLEFTFNQRAAAVRLLPIFTSLQIVHACIGNTISLREYIGQNV